MKTLFRLSIITIALALTSTACGLLPGAERATPTTRSTALVPTRTNTPQAVSPTRVTPPSGATSLAPSAEVENVARLKKVGEMQVTDPIRLTWSPDAKSLGTVTQSGFSLLNPQTFQSSRAVAINQPTNLLDLSPDLRVYAQTSDQQTLELRDTSSNTLLRSIKPGGTFGDAVFAPDGKTFAVTSMDEIAATLWDVQTGQQIKKLTGFQTAAPVYQVAFSADGKTLLWISRGTIQLMDIASAKLGAKFQHEDFIFDQALTPDGRTLITAAEGTIIFWDVATGKKYRVNPPLNPTSIALSPGGRVLAFGAGNDIFLWDVANLKPLRTLTGHTDRVTSVAFAPDGMMLASSGDDDVVKMWAAK